MNYLLTSWGSSGDLVPFLALGVELRARGHGVTLVGNPEWATRAEVAGIRFVPAYAPRPEVALAAHPDLFKEGQLGLLSFRCLMEKILVPILAETYATLEREVSTHDVLVAHHFVFPAALAQEKTGIPWATVCLAPGVTPSAWHGPAGSSLPPLPGAMGRMMQRLIWQLGRRALEPIVDGPVNRLRAELGLSSARDHMFSVRSRQLVLHLYSPHFAPPPPDWDKRHVVTGFCFDPAPVPALPPEVEEFLAAGSAPWLFTLGTTVVAHPRDFYAEAAASVAGTRHRAILLTGSAANRPAPLPPNVLAVDYLAHAAILPRCAAVAHQCGIGTLAETVRAGIPAVACPFAFDQPNNAVRLAELGVARTLSRRRRTAAGFREVFAQLLASDAPQKARALAQKIATENGPARACEALENALLK